MSHLEMSKVSAYYKTANLNKKALMNHIQQGFFMLLRNNYNPLSRINLNSR